MDREKEELCRSIQQSFKMLKASLEGVLDQRKAELKKNSGFLLAKQKKESLAAQKRELQAAQNEVQVMVEFVVHNVDRINNQDLVHIRRELETKLKEEMKLYQRLKQTTVTPDEFLSASSNTLGSVFLQLSPALVKFKVFEHRELCKVLEPWGIAINNKDELVVCTARDERGTGDVVVLSREDEKCAQLNAELV